MNINILDYQAYCLVVFLYYYTISWEQRKVKEMFKITRGNVLSTDKISLNYSEKYRYPVYSSQTQNNGLLGFYSEFLYENAITWTTDGANAGTVKFRNGKFFCTNVCGVLLFYNFKPNKMIAEGLGRISKKYVSFVGNPKLMNNVMSKIEINLPINLSEQNQIGTLFAKLDNLITLHQRKSIFIKV